MRRDDSTGPPTVPGDEGRTPDDVEQRADEQHFRELRRARQTRVAKVVAVLAIVVVLMIFIISNDDPAPVSFVFFTREPPLIWVMFACAVLGGIIGYLIGRPGKQVRLHRRPPGEKD